MEQGNARSLYEDREDPAGYEAAAERFMAGTPKRAEPAPYAPVRLTGQPTSGRGRVILFTIGAKGQPDYYEGVIEDPVPARHYAKMLLDVATVGETQALVGMLHSVLGEENMRRLAKCDDLNPNDLINIMTQVSIRASGPYEQFLGK